jgi:hypothetical protein
VGEFPCRKEAHDVTRDPDPVGRVEKRAPQQRQERRLQGGSQGGPGRRPQSGREEGRKEGERALVRKLLTLRFGKLPADAEQRLERASLAELERWAERVLTAKSLAAVLAD